MQDDYDRRTAGTGDMNKSVAEFKKFVTLLKTKAQAAEHELETAGEPGMHTSDFVGFMGGYQSEGWYDHWYS